VGHDAARLRLARLPWLSQDTQRQRFGVSRFRAVLRIEDGLLASGRAAQRLGPRRTNCSATNATRAASPAGPRSGCAHIPAFGSLPVGRAPVKRMVRVERKAVVADVAAIAVVVVGPFASVTIAAEGLQRAQAERVPIASVRRIVVRDRRRREATLCKAGSA
jgi:hypothetical protein